MPNFLFFSVSAGAGHDMAAQAVIQEIKYCYPNCKTKVIDTLDFVNPTLNKLVLGGYMKSLKISPRIWSKIYGHLEYKENSFDFCQLLAKLAASKFTNIIMDFGPDVIICTHPIPAGIISFLKAKCKFQIPLIALITDFTVHHYWIHENIDAYILPCEQLKDEILRFGVNEDKIIMTGIPLRRQFTEKFNKKKVRSELGLEQKATVLVMGGGHGLGKIENVVNTIVKSDIDLQLITVTGKNKRLSSKLSAIDAGKRVKIYGFVENIAKVMSAADLVITKPGGVTTAEIITLGLPMIIINPLPGQEIRNTEFLVKNGLAMGIDSTENLVSRIKQLISDKAQLSKMRETAKKIAKPNSAKHLVNYLCKYVYSGGRQCYYG